MSARSRTPAGGLRALTESRFLRFLTFSALYLAQGIPWGFITKGYVVFLTDQGLNNEAVGGAVALAYMPWTFKIIWGPILDRFPSARFGRRRPYIIGAEFLMGATMLGLLLINPSKALSTVGVVLFLHNTFAALQDVAVDALAVDILPEDERGKANSFMWASKVLGVGLGGSLGLIVGKRLGWPTLFVAIALVIWAIMALVIAIRERASTEGEAVAAEAGPRLTVREVLRSFSFAAPLMGVVISMLTPVGYALVGTVSTRMLRADLKFSEESIAAIGAVSPFASVAGALVGGPLADRLGARRVIGGCMAAIALSLAVFAMVPSWWPSWSFILGWNVASDFFIAAFSAAGLGFYMSLSNPAIGATQFAVYMAATNLTYTWTSYVGGAIADRWGIAATFAVAALAQLAAIALLPFCDPRQAEARFRSSERGGKDAAAPVAIPSFNPAAEGASDDAA